MLKDKSGVGLPCLSSVLLFLPLLSTWPWSRLWLKHSQARLAATDVPLGEAADWARRRQRPIKVRRPPLTLNPQHHLSLDLVHILICTWKTKNPPWFCPEVENSKIRAFRHRWAVENLLTRFQNIRVAHCRLCLEPVAPQEISWPDTKKKIKINYTVSNVSISVERKMKLTNKKSTQAADSCNQPARLENNDG